MRVVPRLFSSTYSAPIPTGDTAPSPWALALTQPTFRNSGMLIILLLGLFAGLGVPPFYSYIQQRSGMLLPDPLLRLLPCYNVALPIFLLMYGALIVGMGWLLRHPWLLLRGLLAYLLLSVLRMACIWLLPLQPPPGLLPMPDPLASLFLHTSSHTLITKDLFFSGHTSTVTLLALAVRGYWWRRGLTLVAVAVGLLVLIQRVHYSYDVLAAPFFAWLAYWLTGFLTRLIVGTGGLEQGSRFTIVVGTSL